MTSKRWSRAGGLAVAALLAACGGVVERSAAEAGGAADPGGLGGAGGFGSEVGPELGTGGEGGRGAAGPEGYCEQACSATHEMGCLTTADCRAYCEAESGGWPTEVRAAFATCAAENPLCYQSIEGCLLGELHSPGSRLTVRLRVSGLAEHVGRTLRVWHDPGTPPGFGSEIVLDTGELELEWTEPVDTAGPLLLAYVDVDGDGECLASVDETSSLNTTWNGDLLAPVYEAVLAPPLRDPDFVCNYAP